MKRFNLFLIFCVLFLFSCASVKDIPNDVSAEQLIQMGQDMYATGQYGNAIIYYQTAIERFGQDARVYVESRYELTQVHFKQRKYELAYNEYKEIENLYATSSPGTLPAAFGKLAKIGISKIPEKKLPKASGENSFE